AASQLMEQFEERCVAVGLDRVWRAGGNLSKTIVSGVGKRDDEIEAALTARCRYICIESAAELDAVIRVAARLGVQAPVTVRVNPDVDPKTHPYISTGLRENKFGVPSEEALALYARGNASEHVVMVGLSCHIGSQITDLSPFIDAAKRVASLATELRASGTPLEHVGMGGGLGIPYGGAETPPIPSEYGAAMRDLLGPLGLTLILEPGRVIVGNAGVLLTRIVRLKRHGEHHFAIADTGMNDLIRPALYQAKHVTIPVEGGPATERYDLVGPVCESADTFDREIELPRLTEGSLLALRSAGAYAFVMASNYNGRPRPAEVLCRDGSFTVVRERETLTDLYRGERTLNGDSLRPDVPGFLPRE
ncbi:MAG: diaminopimelate decarboxylase, partial [Myxococcota bacterium]